MNCIAIWCSSKNESGVPHSLEAHFNLWKLGKRKNTNCFLDIGLMIQNATKISHVNIFIPHFITSSNIEDLGITFRRNPDLISTLWSWPRKNITIESGSRVRTSLQSVRFILPPIPGWKAHFLRLSSSISGLTKSAISTIRC